jgi:hypothetical protein
MSDATTLLILAAASCIVVPVGVVAWAAFKLASESPDDDGPRNVEKHTIDRFTDWEGFGRVGCRRPGSHPTGHAAFGVDGASRFDPARGEGA